MGARILVIEDDPVNRRFLEEFLALSGYDPVAVETGEEGIREIDKGPFDLILLDLMLPGKNGAEVAWHARERGVQTPIIAISAALDQWDHDDLADLGFTKAIEKPYTNAEILSEIRAALGPTK